MGCSFSDRNEIFLPQPIINYTIDLNKLVTVTKLKMMMLEAHTITTNVLHVHILYK